MTFRGSGILIYVGQIYQQRHARNINFRDLVIGEYFVEGDTSYAEGAKGMYWVPRPSRERRVVCGG